MAAFNYGPIRNVAIGLLKKFGRPTPCRLIRAVDGDAPDPAKPWRVGAPTTYTFDFTGVCLPHKQAISAPTVYPDLTCIAPGDAVTVASNEDAAVILTAFLETDSILTGGINYSIISNDELKPGADAILFKLRLTAWRPTTMTPSTPF